MRARLLRTAWAIALASLCALLLYAVPCGRSVAYGTAAPRLPAGGQVVQGNPITGLPGFSVDLGLSSATGMIAAVLIYQGGKQIQELPICTSPVAQGGRVGTFDIADLNFDGYPDLMLQVTAKQSNYTYCVWLFDPQAKRFAASPQLSQLTNPRPDSQARTVISYENQNCFGACYDKKTYVWSKGQLQLIREIAVTENMSNIPGAVEACGYVLTRQERKHGRMVVVSTSRVNNFGEICWG
jgi:hypothetical protein